MPQSERIKRVFEFENKNEVCIYPSFATYKSKIWSIIRKDNYALTTHVPYTISILTNTTSNLTLYMLPLSYATPITFILPRENYILYVERIYGGNAVYIRSEKADFNSRAIVYLRPYDVYYKIKVFTDNFQSCFSSEDIRISSTEYRISSCSELENITKFEFRQILKANCEQSEYNENYVRVVCSFYTLDNLDHNVNFTVYKLTNLFDKAVYYSDSIKATTGTFSTLLQKGFEYRIVIRVGSSFDIFTKLVDLKEAVFTQEGIIISILLFMTLTFVGLFNPFISIVLGVIALAISVYLNLIYISISSLIGIIIVAILIKIKEENV